jgi:hypothetical protein
MPDLAPTFCPVLPDDFLRQARFEVRRKTASHQSVTATSLPSCSTRIHAWVTRWQANVWACRAGRSSVGPRATFPWPMPQDGAARPIFPPLDQAVVKAVACELVAETKPPLSRQALADVTARTQTALGKLISRSTVWRLRATDAIKPWRYKYWIVPRDPHVAEKAGPMQT